MKASRVSRRNFAVSCPGRLGLLAGEGDAGIDGPGPEPGPWCVEPLLSKTDGPAHSFVVAQAPKKNAISDSQSVHGTPGNGAVGTTTCPACVKSASPAGPKWTFWC